MSDRYDQLQPPHIISAIKSMPRRWSNALHLQPPENIDDYFTVAGPDGRSAAEHAGAMLAQIATLSDAIRTTSYNISEDLGPEVASARNDAGSGPWPDDAATALRAIEADMEALAVRLDALSADDWNKTASLGANSVTVSQLAQGAVRVAAERLRGAERTLDAVT